MTTSQPSLEQYYVRNKHFFISSLECFYLTNIKESLLSNVFDIKTHILENEKLQNTLGYNYTSIYKNHDRGYRHRLGNIVLLDQFSRGSQPIDLNSKSVELDITIAYFVTLLRFYNNVKNVALNQKQKKIFSAVEQSIQSVTHNEFYKYISPLIEKSSEGAMLIKPNVSYKECFFKHSTLKSLSEHYSPKSSTAHYGPLGCGASEVLSSIKKINEFNENIYLGFNQLLPKLASCALDAITLFESSEFYTQFTHTINKDVLSPAALSVDIYYPSINENHSYTHVLSHSIFKPLFTRLLSTKISLASKTDITINSTNLHLTYKEDKVVEYDEYLVYIKNDKLKEKEAGFLSTTHSLSHLWTESESFISTAAAREAIKKYASFHHLNADFLDWQIIKAKMQVTSLVKSSPKASSGWEQVIDKNNLEKSVATPVPAKSGDVLIPAKKFKI